MHKNEQLISDFYSAFQRKDGAAMAAAYHPEARFSDAVFTDLRGAEIGNMWKMLCERGKDLAIEFRDVKADDAKGSAHWDARYTFAATGRKVLNQIDAGFEFKDGKLLRHTDSFGFHRWASQALGPVGLLLGWTPLIRGKVQKTAAANLKAWTAKRGS